MTLYMQKQSVYGINAVVKPCTIEHITALQLLNYLYKQAKR